MKLTDEQKDIIRNIYKMSQLEMASTWRFAPSGHLYFDKTLPYNKHFQRRFKRLGGMTPEISKQLG